MQSPPGWPVEVLPPGADGWQQQAVALLLESCPAEFRTERLLSRYPWVLAVFADFVVRGQQATARNALAEIRAQLDGRVEAHVVQATIDIWQAESARLERVTRQVTLLRQALSGERFVPTMSGRWAVRPPVGGPGSVTM